MKIIAQYNNLLYDENGDLIVSFKIKNHFSKAKFQQMDKESSYSLDFKLVKDKRTLQQNKMMWELCKELAMKINGDTDINAIYCNAIERFSPVFIPVLTSLDNKDKLLSGFRAIKLLSVNNVNGQQVGNFQCFVGSSNFNKKEMGMLIDGLLFLAEEAKLDWQYWKSVFDVS
jgi:hypothetical protein